jgi:hypothetical protein
MKRISIILHLSDVFELGHQLFGLDPFPPAF